MNLQGSLAIPNIVEGVVLIIVLLLSLSIHECAHAAVANLFGDSTAKDLGRLSINPLRHWDRIGTTLLVLLILLNSLGLPVPVFGWGKPVAVDESNFENPRTQGLQVALAGPMSNFILAAVLAVLLRSLNLPSILQDICLLGIQLNLFLMLFNLLPIPPLDGSRILRLVVSEERYYALASNPIFFFAIFFLVLSFLLPYLELAVQVLTNFLLGAR